MKAAILVKSKSPLIVSELKRPTNLEFGQVLVKIFYSGICGAQLNEIDAAKGKDKFLPHLLGHEGSGKILDVGPGVKQLKKMIMLFCTGDKVMAFSHRHHHIKWEIKKLMLDGSLHLMMKL